MDLYTKLSFDLSRQLTNSYSTSFGLSSRLFSREIRRHIYAIYGLVRIADEIVDTYKGDDQKLILNNLEDQIYSSMNSGYSSNPIVHSFVVTAKKFGIDRDLIEPFFESMRKDIGNAYKPSDYKEYIYGSAEVVGLMCLKVFCFGDEDRYTMLAPGARALGSAYQKVNFLRDMRQDNKELGRVYFPNVSFKSFSNKDKKIIEADIEKDYINARESINALPISSRVAVSTSYRYYQELLSGLKQCSARGIKSRRVRVADSKKLIIMLIAILRLGKV